MLIIELLASRHFTGPAERIIHLMRGLSRHGHRIVFAHTQEPPGTLAQELDLEPVDVFQNIALQRKGLVLPGLFRDVRHLNRLVACCDQRVICHVHTSHDHWVAWCLARLPNSPVSIVRSVHETRQAKRRIADTPLFRDARMLIAISESMKSSLSAAYGVDPAKIAVVQGSVDTEKFKPGLDTTAILREIGADQKTPLIGIVSRIKGGRGHRLLVEAFEQLSNEFHDFRLMIVGRGESKSELEELVHARGLDQRIHFMGYRREDLPEIYNVMSAKVILGEGSDGTCRAALEAMACGVPVIAAMVGALPETVSQGETGFLVDADDAGALAEAMRAYVADPELVMNHGAAARDHALQRFGIDRMVESTESIFAKIAQEANDRQG